MGSVFLECRLPHEWLRWPWHERIAILFGDVDGKNFYVTDCVPARNASDRQREFCALTKGELRRVERKLGQHAIGFIHSHPFTGSNEPSTTDLTSLPAHWLGGVYQFGDVQWYLRSRNATTR